MLDQAPTWFVIYALISLVIGAAAGLIITMIGKGTQSGPMFATTMIVMVSVPVIWPILVVVFVYSAVVERTNRGVL